MFRRRRQARKVVRVARMLRELDAVACDRPAARPRRVGRAAFSRI
jgi:hypothetical protein